MAVIIPATSAFAGRGGVLRTEILGDERLKFGFLHLADYVEDAGPPLRAAKAIAKADMQERFRTDTDPEGNPWIALDPDYLKKKAGMSNLRTHPDDILTLSRKLENAATSEASWGVSEAGDTLFFSTTHLPNYWAVHQLGSGDAGNVGSAADFRERISVIRQVGEGEAGGAHDSFGIGRGQATPRRPFIGLSDEAQLQIIEVFDTWYDEGVRINISRAGIVQERVGGRFGRRLFPAF